MAKNKFRTPYHIGAHVEDASGIIGTITGHGKWVGSVTVDFGNGVTRDLFTDKLKPARYTPEQVKAMESEAVRMFEAAQNLIDVWNAGDLASAVRELNKVLEETKAKCHTQLNQLR